MARMTKEEWYMMIENALRYVKQIFGDDCSGHDYYHTMRVHHLSV
jgi:hypothetical protein